MNRLRTATIFAILTALYFAADAATHGRLPPIALGVAAVAVLLATSPRFLRAAAEVEEPGTTRVGLLGPLAAVALSVPLVPSPSPFVRVLGLVAVFGLAALSFDLSLDAPDAPGRLVRIRTPGLVAAVAGLAVALLLAFDPRGRETLRAARPEAVALAVGLGLATVVRLLRTRLASAATAHAGNAWALLGLVPATACAVHAATLHVSPFGRGVPWPDGAPLLPRTLACVALLAGHVAMVEPSRRLEAAVTMRRAVEWALSGSLAAVVMALAAAAHPPPAALGALAVVVVALAEVVRRLARPIVLRVLAPFGGRLLDACDKVRAALLDVTTLEALGAAVLVPMRAASSDPSAEPELWLFDPPRSVRLDAAGNARVRRDDAPEILRTRFASDGSPVIFHELDRGVVRVPELRPLHEVLVRRGALVVLPIRADEATEGCLVVPRGQRSTPPSLEELAALASLARSLASPCALFGAHIRAEERVTRLGFERDRAEEARDEARTEGARLRTEVRALRRARGDVGLPATVVAYAAESKAFEQALDAVAPSLSAVTLVAEPGAHVDRIARRIHDDSGVREGPFVLVDCAALPVDSLDRVFFGVDGEPDAPGFLQLADGGTLLLADVAALPLELQRTLSEAFATRGARLVGSHATYGFDARLLCAARAPLEDFVARGVLDPELARRLGQVELRVPPLRARRDDLRSLALLELHRACLRLGRPPMGLSEEAVDVLLAHPFPGNLRELELAVDRAVRATDGTLVAGTTLASVLAGGEPVAGAPSEHPLDTNLVEIERRALRRALERADGNKSEAARFLGVARTTFLDKWRRLRMDEGGTPSVPPPE